MVRRNSQFCHARKVFNGSSRLFDLRTRRTSIALPCKAWRNFITRIVLLHLLAKIFTFNLMEGGGKSRIFYNFHIFPTVLFSISTFCSYIRQSSDQTRSGINYWVSNVKSRQRVPAVVVKWSASWLIINISFFKRDSRCSGFRKNIDERWWHT